MPNQSFPGRTTTLWNTSAGTGTGYVLIGQGSIPGRGKSFFFSEASTPALEPA
jgi:hypothetical protein